jgi:hypothetical protein
MAMDPEKVLARLRELAGNGFDVKVPDRVFRSIELRAHVAESVTVAQRRVSVAVTQNTLYTSPELLWYSARVAVRPSRSRQGPTTAGRAAARVPPAQGLRSHPPGPPRKRPSGGDRGVPRQTRSVSLR